MEKTKEGPKFQYQQSFMCYKSYIEQRNYQHNIILSHSSELLIYTKH